jgi:hypothetical protein
VSEFVSDTACEASEHDIRTTRLECRNLRGSGRTQSLDDAASIEEREEQAKHCCSCHNASHGIEAVA